MPNKKPERQLPNEISKYTKELEQVRIALPDNIRITRSLFQNINQIHLQASFQLSTPIVLPAQASVVSPGLAVAPRSLEFDFSQSRLVDITNSASYRENNNPDTSTDLDSTSTYSSSTSSGSTLLINLPDSPTATGRVEETKLDTLARNFSLLKPPKLVLPKMSYEIKFLDESFDVHNNDISEICDHIQNILHKHQNLQRNTDNFSK